MSVCVFTSTQGGTTFGTCRGTRRPDVTEAMGLGEDGEAASHRFLALNEPAVVAQRGCLGGQVQTSPSPHSPAEIPGCRCQRGARKSGGRGPTVPEPKVNSGQMPSSLPPGSTYSPTPSQPPSLQGVECSPGSWSPCAGHGVSPVGRQLRESKQSGACQEETSRPRGQAGASRGSSGF